MLEELEFVYLPSTDVASELERYVDELGAEVVYAIERFGTRVAMVRIGDTGPRLLLAQHLHGDQPVLLYRVADLDAAEAELRSRGATLGERFEFPDGDAVEIGLAGPQRIAVFQRTQPERAASIVGRRDF